MIEMDKEEIIKKLESAKYWEDEFIKNYDNEDIWTLLESLPKKKFKKIKELLKENISDTEKHKSMVEEIIKKLRSGKIEL